MVWPVLFFQKSFDHFCYKRAIYIYNLIWSNSALFSFVEFELKNKVAILPFDQSKSFDQRAIQFDPYCLAIILTCVFYKILFKIQYGLTSSIVSLKTELPANLEIRELWEKSGNQILSQIVREKSQNFQFLTKSQGKTVCAYNNFQ